MSIIYDALKKVEGTFKDADKIEQKVKSDALPRRKALNRYVVIIVISCVGFLSASFGYNFFVNLIINSHAVSPAKVTAALKQSAPSSAKALPATASLTAPVAVPAASIASSTPSGNVPAPAFVLNGVFYSADQGYALVNNQIVREGDVISGMTVTKIATNEVELKAQDSIVKLATNSR